MTLHRSLMVKVKARSLHVCTTRLACPRSRVSAYQIEKKQKQKQKRTHLACFGKFSTLALFFSFFCFCSVPYTCVGFLVLGGSVGGVKKKNDKTSENRRPETPALLPWSLKITRRGPQIDTNSIWGKYDGQFHNKKIQKG